jgi:hypothetical protein
MSEITIEEVRSVTEYEAAQLLNVSVTTVRRQRDKLGAYRIGGKSRGLVRVPLAGIAKLQNRNRLPDINN